MCYKIVSRRTNLRGSEIMRDMTKGNSAKHIFMFTLPMLLGNVLQQLYNTVDSAVVGRFVGTEALAATGASFPIIFLLVSAIIGVTMGATIMIAQFYGAKDMAKVKLTIDTTMIALFLASIIASIVGYFASDYILVWLNTPADVLPLASEYLKITFIGLVAMFGYNTVSAILRGLGDSKTPLYFLILSTIINIVLDLLFVIVFEMGVAGAAWATAIAQGVSFVAAAIYLNKTSDVFNIKPSQMSFDKDILKQSLKIGLPTGVQQILVSLGMIFIQRIVNPFGTSAMAAYTVGMRLDSFGRMPIMNFSTAISSFVGQNIGANKHERIESGYKASVVMSGVISIGVSILAFAFGKQLISIFDSNPEVISIGYSYLKITSSFYLAMSLMFITSGLLRGAGDTFVPMVISVITLWIIRLPFATIMSGVIGINGIWFAFPAGWVVGAILTYIYYKTGKWNNKGVIKRSEEIEGRFSKGVHRSNDYVGSSN